MKTFTKQIISPMLLLIIYTLNLTNGNSCEPSNCPQKIGINDVSVVRYPFRINDIQPQSCGMPGYDLYCDNLGTLIRFPNNIVLKVDAIFYYNEQIFLSDPYKHCIPEKLMNFDLIGTPFFPGELTKKFWLYNCSGYVDEHYDRIDCLSGLDYTVISSGSDFTEEIGSSNCTFVKILNVPVSYESIELSQMEAIELSWDGTTIPPPPKIKSSNTILHAVKLVIGLLGIALIILFCCYQFHMRRIAHVSATIHANRILNSPPIDIGGLDQVTIDSYPIVVVGESGRLIKTDDTCSICLSDYRSHDRLKLLPQCLHRFHSDCIDQWLRSKGTCPLCRTSPPHVI